ncbi:MAG: DUF2269 family protein [Gemmatimonadaceae bacterium]|nr:DUF2269 family protein [Gemmatimonadaceae bacterium]
MILSDSALRAIRVVHVLAAILFAGNVIVTGVWAAIMFRERERIDFRLPARAIVITDWVFTLGGAILLVGTGVTLALGRGYPMWGTRWIREAIIGLSLSTTVWLLVLVPAQRKMLRFGPGQDAELRRTYGRWNATGWLAAVPLLWSLWCMVYKPA